MERKYIRIPMGTGEQAVSFMPCEKETSDPYGFFLVTRWKPVPKFEEVNPLFPDESLVRLAVQTAGSMALEAQHPRWLLPTHLIKGLAHTTEGPHARRLAAQMDMLRKYYPKPLPEVKRSYLADKIPIQIDDVVLQWEEGENGAGWRFSKREFPLLTAAKFSHCILRDRLTAKRLAKYAADFLAFPPLELLEKGDFRLARDRSGGTALTPEDELVLILNEIVVTLEAMNTLGTAPSGDTASLADICPLALAELGRNPAGSITAGRDRNGLYSLIKEAIGRAVKLESPGSDVMMLLDVLRLSETELTAPGTKQQAVVWNVETVETEPPDIPLELLVPERQTRKDAQQSDESAGDDEEGDEEEPEEVSITPPTGNLVERIVWLESKVVELYQRLGEVESRKKRKKRTKE